MQVIKQQFVFGHVSDDDDDDDDNDDDDDELFYGIVDRQKVLDLISSRDHC